jgi:serine/threonine protein kinase
MEEIMAEPTFPIKTSNNNIPERREIINGLDNIPGTLASTAKNNPISRLEHLAKNIARMYFCHVMGKPVESGRNYFARFPDLLQHPKLVMKILYAEFQARRVFQPDLCVAEFAMRYPDFSQSPEWEVIFKPMLTPLTMETSEWTNQRKVETNAPATNTSLNWLQRRLLPSSHATDLGIFADFRIMEVLAKGGMGVVVRAVDRGLDREVAIKLIRPDVALDAKMRKRFFREARAVAELEHPRIVSIHQVGECEGVPFLVMPLLRGQSLRDRLNLANPITIQEILAWTREILEGLEFIHSRGLIHRDIKPENIWLEETYSGRHVRLLDFGLVRSEEDQTITELGVIMGTVAYMAPEQTDGQPLTPQADLFSLGSVVYEMIMGEPAFLRATPIGTMYAVTQHLPVSPSQCCSRNIPESLSNWTMKLLQKLPRNRFASAHEALAALPVLNHAAETVRINRVVEKPKSVLQATDEFFPMREDTSVKRSWLSRTLSKLRR